MIGPSKVPSYRVWMARVIYGDLTGAEASLDKIANIESKAGRFASLADLLWRMKQPELARSRFEKARKLAAQIPELKARTRVLDEVKLGLTYVSEEPPIVVSPVPQPRERSTPSEPTLPNFPMTTDGFRERSPAVREALMRSDEAFLKALYDRMAVKDRAGVFAMAEGAKTVRHRSLGFAGVGHILIQGAQAEAAEDTIRRMPEVDVDSRLAKAEALTRLAAAGQERTSRPVLCGCAGIGGGRERVADGQVSGDTADGARAERGGNGFERGRESEKGVGVSGGATRATATGTGPTGGDAGRSELSRRGVSADFGSGDFSAGLGCCHDSGGEVERVRVVDRDSVADGGPQGIGAPGSETDRGPV